MKRDDESLDDILDRHLPSAAKDEMEEDGDRVWGRLRERAEAMPPRLVSKATPVLRWRPVAALLAAAAVLAVAFIGMRTGAAFATVERMDGALYRVHDAGTEAIAAGDELQSGDTVRTNGGSGTTLVLADGSRVEMRSKSELSMEHADDGISIRLSEGSVIVDAAKQAAGRHLYVQTRDVKVSVVGTVFLVKAQEEGSRVAVIEGEVRVQQGTTEKKLGPGYQVATNPKMESLPVSAEIAWSRHAETHLALLQQSTVVPTDLRVAFEVASIRPTAVTGGGGRGGGGVRPGGEPCGQQSRFPQVDPRRFATTDSTALALILLAYGKDCQIWHGSDLVVGGPGWVKSDGFDIEARIPEGSPSYTAEQLHNHEAPNLQLMLQSLLADRFKLTLRREMRELPAYVLTFKKASPKLAAWKEGDPPGRTVAAGRDPQFNLQVSAVIVGGKQSMAGLARQIGEVTRRPVVDKTGLPGEFNYSFKFTPPDVLLSEFPAGAPVLPGPSLMTAIEELGLKLEETKGPIEVLVIDRVERPTEN